MPGVAPTVWVECPGCQGAPRRVQACSRCEGKGTIKVDPYIHERPALELVAPVDINVARTTMTRHEIDSWLDRVRTGGRHWAERPGMKPYQRLERALSITQRLNPGAYSVLHCIYWAGLDERRFFGGRQGWIEAMEPRAIATVDRNWPTKRGGKPLPVLLPRWLEEEERRRRDDRIRVLSRSGMKQVRIAEEVGVDVRTVKRALGRAA